MWLTPPGWCFHVVSWPDRVTTEGKPLVIRSVSINLYYTITNKCVQAVCVSLQGARACRRCWANTTGLVLCTKKNWQRNTHEVKLLTSSHIVYPLIAPQKMHIDNLLNSYFLCSTLLVVIFVGAVVSGSQKNVPWFVYPPKPAQESGSSPCY